MGDTGIQRRSCGVDMHVPGVLWCPWAQLPGVVQLIACFRGVAAPELRGTGTWPVARCAQNTRLGAVAHRSCCAGQRALNGSWAMGRVYALVLYIKAITQTCFVRQIRNSGYRAAELHLTQIKHRFQTIKLL